MSLPKKDAIIPAITFGLSILNLYKNSIGISYGSCFVSIIGLSAFALYLLRINYSRIVFYLWAISQLVIIRQQIPQGAGGELLTNDIFDLSQGFKWAFYVPVRMNSTQYEVGLNIIAVFMILLHRVLPGRDLKGVELSFSPYRHDNSMGQIFPVKGIVEKNVTLSNENNWLLVKLNRTVQYDAMNIGHVLIKRNDKKPVIPGQNNQLVFFKPVPDLNMICEKDNDKTSFPIEVWALCK